MSDFIPTNAATFLAFAQNIMERVGENITVWTHIKPTTVSEFSVKLNAFKNEQEAITPDSPRSHITRRNEAQKELEKHLRYFIKFYLRNPIVTNDHLITMGIPPLSTTRTVKKEVTERVDFTIQTRGIRKLVVDFKQRDKTNKAKPKGYDGAVVLWHIGERPNKPEDFRYHAVASRTPFLIDFEDNERGQTVWIALCWQNARSIRGRWSDFKSSVVP